MTPIQRLLDAAQRLVSEADFKLGGALSSESKSRDIPSNAYSQIKARHLASLRDAVRAALAETAEPVLDVQDILESLALDIEAIGVMYRGSPSYEHDAHWMRKAAVEAVRNLASRLVAAPQPPAPAVDELEAATQDALLYGTGFVVDGKRVAPELVWMTKKPAPAVECGCEELLEALKDLLHQAEQSKEPWWDYEQARAAIAAHEKKRGEA